MWSEEEDHILIHNFRTGDTVTIEGVETDVWKLIDGRRDINEIVQIISVRHGIDRDNLMNETQELITGLIDADALRFLRRK